MNRFRPSKKVLEQIHNVELHSALVRIVLISQKLYTLGMYKY